MKNYSVQELIDCLQAINDKSKEVNIIVESYLGSYYDTQSAVFDVVEKEEFVSLLVDEK